MPGRTNDGARTLWSGLPGSDALRREQRCRRARTERQRLAGGWRAVAVGGHQELNRRRRLERLAELE